MYPACLVNSQIEIQVHTVRYNDGIVKFIKYLTVVH